MGSTSSLDRSGNNIHKYPPPWFSQFGSSKSGILVMETTSRPKLYSYFRSSCSWRVRIALELAGVKVDQVAVHLVKGGGEQHAADYKKLNPKDPKTRVKVRQV